MFKWVEIATENNKARYETLSRFMSDLNFPNQVDFITVSAEEFPQVIESLQAKYDGIRIGRGLGEVVVPYFQGNPLLVNQIQVADTIFKVQKNWTLRVNAAEGFSRVLAKAGDLFDLDSSVLVVGTGAASKVAIRGLYRAGFKRFAISSLDVRKVENMIAELKKTFFTAEFQVIPKDGLILLPGRHGVLVNTTPMTDDNPLLAELVYFNFFKQGGVAIDFTVSPPDTTILNGAKDVGAHCIYGYQIAAQTDVIWCEQVSRLLLDVDKYDQELSSALRASTKKS